MASERLQGEEQLHSKYYLWKCLIPIHAKMCLKSAAQKLDFVIVKTILKS